MESNQVGISTIMLARTAQEEQVLRASLAALSRLLLPIYVADGGSPEGLVNWVECLPGVTLIRPTRRGLIAQVKTSLTAAQSAGHPFVLYTEPDKQHFFETAVLDLVRRAPDVSAPGLMLASRTNDSFSTFPPLQRFTESTINRMTGEAVGQVGDYSYGPFLIDRALIDWVDDVPDDIGWGWRHYLFVTAQRLGHGVMHFPGDFPCPPHQRDEDDQERAHRIRQLSQNIEGLSLALKVDERRAAMAAPP
jgi:hypothetical protein